MWNTSAIAHLRSRRLRSGLPTIPDCDRRKRRVIRTAGANEINRIGDGQFQSSGLRPGEFFGDVVFKRGFPADLPHAAIVKAGRGLGTNTFHCEPCRGAMADDLAKPRASAEAPRDSATAMAKRRQTCFHRNGSSGRSSLPDTGRTSGRGEKDERRVGVGSVARATAPVLDRGR